MFEFHQVQIAGDQVQIGEIGLLDHVAQLHRILIADRVIQRAAIQQVKHGLKPVQCRQAGLRAQVDAQNLMAIQHHFLRQMRDGGGLARVAFEVDHGDHLKMVALTPPGQVSAWHLGPGLKQVAQGLDILGRIVPATSGAGLGRGATAIQMQLAQIGVLDA